MSNIGLGKKVRMSRMVNPVSNKMMAITVDHAISRGIAPMTGLHSIQSTIDKIVAGKPDAMTVTPGILNQCWDAEKNRDVAILCKVSNYSPVAPTQDIVFGNVDEAIALGASGVSMGAMTLGTYQGVQFETIGRFAAECMQKGMPLIGHVYPKGESVPVEERTSWENIAYCIRSACEMGMDIVKTTYCGNPDAMAKALSTVPSGFRVVIQGGDAPADLEGMVLRTPSNSLYVEFFTACGANATPMSFSEVYNALQLNTLDGQENPVDVPATNNFYEVQKYISATNHIADAWIVGMNTNKLNGLTENQQNALRQAAEECQQWYVDYQAEKDGEMLKLLTDNGMEYNEVPEEGFQEFVSVSQELYPKFKEMVQNDELFDATVAFCGKA